MHQGGAGASRPHHCVETEAAMGVDQKDVMGKASKVRELGGKYVV